MRGSEAKRVTTYHITAGLLSRGKRIRYALLYTVTWLLFFSVFERAVHGHWSDPTALAIGGVIFFLGILLTTSLWPRQKPGVDLEIDDDGIRMVWNRRVVRTVRRDNVRYVAEWGSGDFRKLVISDRGPVFTRWLWGGIGVPACVSGYEEIKKQALSWLDSSIK
jgi:hypothetical protein